MLNLLIRNDRSCASTKSPTQLIGEVREPIPAKSGQLERYDSEYQRNGTVNLFIFLDTNRAWRHVKITDRRTSIDFAECMRDLVDVHYPLAERVRVVLDNLSTHGPGALYEAFDPEEARRIFRRLEFHFVPKHASWLNMVEIEIGVLRGQCLDRRIEDRATLVVEIAAWEQARNAAEARIEWMFTTDRAREKMGRAYPKPALTSEEQTSPAQIIPLEQTSTAEQSQPPARIQIKKTRAPDRIRPRTKKPKRRHSTGPRIRVRVKRTSLGRPKQGKAKKLAPSNSRNGRHHLVS